MKLGEFIKKNRLSDAMHYDMCFSCDDEQFLLDLIDVDDKNQKINVKLYSEKNEQLNVNDILTQLGVFSGIDEIIALCGKENLIIKFGKINSKLYNILVGCKFEFGGIGIIKCKHNYIYKYENVEEAELAIKNYIKSLPEQHIEQQVTDTKKKYTAYEILSSRGVFSGIDEIVALCGKENLKAEIEYREPNHFVIVVRNKGNDKGIGELKQLYNFYCDVDKMTQIDTELFNYINNLPDLKKNNRKKKTRHKVNERFVKAVNDGFNAGSPDTKIIVKIPFSGVSNKISYFLEHDNRKWQMNEETYKAIVESFKKEVNEDNQTITEQNNILFKAIWDISTACIALDNYIKLPENLSANISKINYRGDLIDSVEVKAGRDPLYDENGSPITHKTKWFNYKFSDVELNMLGKQTLYGIYTLLKSFNSDDINMNEKEKNIIDSVVGENGIIPQTFKKLNMKFQ